MRKVRNLNAVSLGKKLTIAIDIDGTVADCSKVDFSKVNRNKNEFMKAVLIKGALEAVKCLYKQGHIIVFHSSRNYASKKVTQTWLMKYGFPFHHIVMDKFVAHVYIDDRAINGCCWKRVMRELKNPYLPGKIARRKGMV
jgi:predicted secreted acid phosphatase